MNSFDIAIAAVTVMFAVSLMLLLAVVVFKWANGRRLAAREIRRAAYLKLLSQHVAAPGSIAEISVKEADDAAFIDALIDIRHALSGSPADSLDGVIDRAELISHQAKRLSSRFPLGRRLRAVVSLAEIGDPKAAPILMHHLTDRVPEIRVQSARGLARMRHTPAIDVILDRFHDETPWVQSRFAETLALYGRDAVWPLTAWVRVNHNYRRDRGVTEIIRILGIIGDSEVGPGLAELLYTAEDPEVRIAIIETLGIIGGPLALRPLRRMIQSADWRIRAKAATAFSRIGDSSINPILREGLDDQSWWMRRNSAAALASLPGGIDFLYEAIGAAEQVTRDAAAEALADCGELIAARDRLESGESDPRDAQLISYMHIPEPVTS
jgi:HEAT repeat protein